MRKEKGKRRKEKAKFRQHEQRTSNEVRTQFVPFGARTANAGKEERAKRKEQRCGLRIKEKGLNHT